MLQQQSNLRSKSSLKSSSRTQEDGKHVHFAIPSVDTAPQITRKKSISADDKKRKTVQGQECRKKVKKMTAYTDNLMKIEGTISSASGKLQYMKDRMYKDLTNSHSYLDQSSQMAIEFLNLDTSLNEIGEQLETKERKNKRLDCPQLLKTEVLTSQAEKLTDEAKGIEDLGNEALELMQKEGIESFLESLSEIQKLMSALQTN